MNAADDALAFLEGLRVSEGPKAGEKLRLAEFQKAFVRGALDPENMVAVWSIARGNSKTATSAGIALGATMGIWDQQPKRDTILAARNRDQAKVAFNFITGFIEGLPPAKRKRFAIRRGSRLEVEYSGQGGGIARCVAADGKSLLGGASTLAILDEKAAHDPAKGATLENAILSGLGKRNGKALIISTAAPDDINAFSRWCDSPPPGTYVQVHAAAPGLPADDLDSLLVANPGASEGIGASPEWLIASARRAISRGGSALSSFRNLNRNERVSTDTRSVLVTTDQWLACETDDLPPREGEMVLGLDLGGSSSMTAIVAMWPRTGRMEAWGAFPGSPSLEDRGANDSVGTRYREMAERSELLQMGAKVVDIAAFLTYSVERLENYPIAQLVCDRFRQAELLEALSKTSLRIAPTWRGQGWASSGPDTELFRQWVFDARIRCKPSLLMRSALSEAVVQIDPTGAAKIAKGRSLARVDAAAAAILAVSHGSRLIGTAKRPARWAWS